MKKKKLPRFNTDEEFGRFVENHDMAPYFDEMEPVDQMLLDPKLAQRIKERSSKRLVTLRLPVWQLDTAKRIAKQQKRPYQRVLQTWVGEGLNKEIRGGPLHSRR
jgi:hypothetical protein